MPMFFMVASPEMANKKSGGSTSVSPPRNTPTMRFISVTMWFTRSAEVNGSIHVRKAAPWNMVCAGSERGRRRSSR